MKLCTACLEKVEPEIVTSGSMIVELGLWIFFVIPGLLYSLWRLSSRHSECPKCGSREMIPLETERAKKLLAV